MSDTRPTPRAFRVLALAAAVALTGSMSFCPALSAQTKAETRLYQKTMKKPSVKSLGKFLEKYPSSAYAAKVAHMRDSIVFAGLDKGSSEALRAFIAEYPASDYALAARTILVEHNTSPLSREKALDIARAGAEGSPWTDAVGYRRDNVDRVLALSCRDGAVVVGCLGLDGNRAAEDRTIETYTMDPGRMAPCMAAFPAGMVDAAGGRYLHFGYVNAPAGTAPGDVASSPVLEWVEVLYDYASGDCHSAMFYGKTLPGEGGGAFRIEGQSPEDLGGVVPTAQVAFLRESLHGREALVPIAKADLLSDESIAWWLAKNPAAQTTARSVVLGTLDGESSIVEEFKNQKKEDSSAFRAAAFDIRGYTVVCAYGRKTGQYLLVWCEPVCRDRNRDQLLSAIYFEGDATLDLFYYKGRKTFKWKVNLSSKTIRR